MKSIKYFLALQRKRRKDNNRSKHHLQQEIKMINVNTSYIKYSKRKGEKKKGKCSLWA